MRNLKKILALVLALVMSFSLVATANAFTDSADVDGKFEEAVEVLAGLKVFEGNPDGSFDPKGDITRAEVAAIIYRIVTKDVEKKQVGIYADYNKFTDVPSTEWYAGYVNYCANAEYIYGYGDGKFGPNDSVTGYAALAMILRAVGYDQNGEFTGEGWEVRVASIANKLGITKNIVAGTLGTAASREMVAEILFQAIQADIVSYTLAFGYQNDRNATNLGYDNFGLEKIEGVITDSDTAKSTIKMDGYTLSNTGADWTSVGYGAYSWVVGKNDAKHTAKSLYLNVIGEELSVTTDGTAIGTLTTYSSSNRAYVADLDDDYIVVVNGEIKASLSAINNKIGAKIALVDNDGDGDIDAVISTEYTHSMVLRVQEKSTSGKITTSYYALKNGAQITPAKLKGVDALAQNNFINYVVVDGYYFVEVLSAKLGEFESITYTKLNNEKVKTYNIGGEGYIGSEMTGVSYTNFLKKENINTNTVFYVDAYGYIVYAMQMPGSTSYLYALGNEHNMALTGVAETEVAYADGSVEIVDVKGVVSQNDYADEIYSYSVKNGVYTIKKATVGKLVDVDYTTDEVSMSSGNVTVKLTQNTEIVDLRAVIAGKADEGTVYTGWNEIPSVVDGKIVYITDRSGNMSLGFLVDGDDPSNNAASFVVFDTTTNVVDKVATGVYTYELTEGVLVKGELVENYVLSQAKKNDIETYGVGVYTWNKDGSLKSYISFAEDTIEWTPYSNGTFIDGNLDVTGLYDFVILNIKAGKVDDWSQLVKAGDYYTYMDKTNKVVYVVGETASEIIAPTTGEGVEFGGNTYWAADGKVTAFEKVTAANTYKDAVDAAKAALAADPKVEKDLTDAKAALAALTGLTDEQEAYVADLTADLDAEIAVFTGLAAVKTAAEAYISSKAGVWSTGIVDAVNAALTEYLAGDSTPTYAEAETAMNNTAWAVYNAQTAALEVVTNAVPADKTAYRAADWAIIEEIVADAEAAIKAESDITAVAKKGDDAKAAIQAVKTDAAKTAAETMAKAKAAVTGIVDASLTQSTTQTVIEGKLTAAGVTGVTVTVSDYVAYADSATCKVTLELSGVENEILTNVVITKA